MSLGEPLTVRVPWSEEFEAQANERFLQSVPRTQRWIHYACWVIVLITIFLVAYYGFRDKLSVVWYFIFLIGFGSSLLELVFRPRHARAMAALRRRMAAEGFEAEWTFTTEGIVHQMGHPPMGFKWKWAQVTRFPDGFVLAIPGAWLQYWLPASAFPDSGVDAFANLARASRAKYRTVAGAESLAPPDHNPG